MATPGAWRDGTIKPEWGAQLDQAHHYAQGLVALWAFNEGFGIPRDVVAGAGASLSGQTWAGGADGVCLQNNSVNDYFDTGISNWNRAAGTVIWRVYPTATATDGSRFFFWGQLLLNGSTYPELCAQRYSDNKLYIGWAYNGDQRIILTCSEGVNYATKAWQTYALTWSSAGSTLYWNGKVVGTNATAPAPSNVGVNLLIGNEGGQPTLGMAAGGKTAYWGCWNRAFTPEEISAFSAQPYALFLTSDVRRFYSAAQVLAKALTESLSFTDARLLGQAKALTEGLTLSDGAAKSGGKALLESLTLADVRSLGAGRKLLETLSLSDAGVSALLNAGGQAFSKSLTEALTFTDARMGQIGKKLAESLALSDARALGQMHKMVEALGLSDQFNTVLGSAAAYFYVQLVASGGLYNDLTGSGQA